MKTEIQNLTQSINRLCDLMEKRLQTQSAPKTQTFASVAQAPQATTTTAQMKPKVQIELTIENGPRPFKSGAGKFYDAWLQNGTKRELVSFGVSSKKITFDFGIGETLHVIADDGGIDKTGKPLFWLSKLLQRDFAQQNTNQAQITQQEDAPDEALFTSTEGTFDEQSNVPF